MAVGAHVRAWLVGFRVVVGRCRCGCCRPGVGCGVRDRVHCGRVERGTVVSEKPETTQEALQELRRAWGELRAVLADPVLVFLNWLTKQLLGKKNSWDEAENSKDPKFMAASALSASANRDEFEAYAAWKVAERHAETCHRLAHDAVFDFSKRGDTNDGFGA